MQLFAALDFETASSERNSACAIGYVIFNHSKILKNKHILLNLPNPKFSLLKSMVNMGYAKKRKNI